MHRGLANEKANARAGGGEGHAPGRAETPRGERALRHDLVLSASKVVLVCRRALEDAHEDLCVRPVGHHVLVPAPCACPISTG